MTPRPDITAHPARVLIVDDERENRELLEIILNWEGFLTVIAATGEEALAIVAQQPPDLILLDFIMPGMDGLEVLARLKGNGATKDIPIVITTGMSDDATRMRALSAGAADVLVKPMDRAELSERVRKVLRLETAGD